MPSEVLVFRKRLESIEEAIRNIAVGGAPVAVAAAAAPVDDAVIADLIKRISELEAAAVPAAAPVDDAVVAELTKRIAELEAVVANFSIAAPIAVAVENPTFETIVVSDVDDSDVEADA